MKNQKNRIVIFSGEQRLGAAARSDAWLAVEDITPGAEPVLTIDKIGAGECVLEQGRKEEHDVIFFREESVSGLPKVRPMIINSTNRKTLLAIYGDLSASTLEGKRVRIYVDPHVRAVGGGTTSGIRIRKLIPEAPGSHHPVQPVRSNPIPPVICQDCGSPITAAGDCDASQVLNNGRQWFHADLCAGCQTRRINAQQPNNQ